MRVRTTFAVEIFNECDLQTFTSRKRYSLELAMHHFHNLTEIQIIYFVFNVIRRYIYNTILLAIIASKQ